ncbi:unnamed protein product [marine sediment metagenome]|uniref:NAD-dependent epimerase/dehydratase domain-containing protein n=1 Tax=marine sediment metagenome TaxID=412755 RepID=X0SNQ2_9ZZZZ
MKVLITGGAGFLGSALANRLLAEGNRVRVLDDLSAGERERLDPGVAFSGGDVRDLPKLWTLLRGVDCVYHLAARVSVPESILYPVEYNAVNVGGTVSLLTAARDAQVRRLVAGLTLSREKLGYRPKTTPTEGLRLTIMRDPRFSAA